MARSLVQTWMQILWPQTMSILQRKIDRLEEEESWFCRVNFKTLEDLCRCPTGGCKCGKGKSNEGVWITSAKNPILTFFYPIEQVFSPNRHRVILPEKEIYYSVSAFKKYRLYYTKKWELPLWKSQWLHLTAVDLTWKHTSTHTRIGYDNIYNFTKLWKWRLSTLLGIFYQSNIKYIWLTKLHSQELV